MPSSIVHNNCNHSYSFPLLGQCHAHNEYHTSSQGITVLTRQHCLPCTGQHHSSLKVSRQGFTMRHVPRHQIISMQAQHGTAPALTAALLTSPLAATLTTIQPRSHHMHTTNHILYNTDAQCTTALPTYLLHSATLDKPRTLHPPCFTMPLTQRSWDQTQPRQHRQHQIQQHPPTH
jgi:hypothetical protein